MEHVLPLQHSAACNQGTATTLLNHPIASVMVQVAPADLDAYLFQSIIVFYKSFHTYYSF